jgi:hypothetical protein
MGKFSVPVVRHMPEFFAGTKPTEAACATSVVFVEPKTMEACARPAPETPCQYAAVFAPV